MNNLNCFADEMQLTITDGVVPVSIHAMAMEMNTSKIAIKL